MMKKTRYEQLLDRLEQPFGDECVEWWGSLDYKGYGRVQHAGKNERAHRISCEHAHGPAPKGKLLALHSCNNRACVSPRHLRWGSPSDNQNDRLVHGTMLRGETQPCSKLSGLEVRAIRKHKGPRKGVASKFGVGVITVERIRAGKTWKHLPWTYAEAEARGFPAHAGYHG